jgi:hypothetical protein
MPRRLAREAIGKSRPLPKHQEISRHEIKEETREVRSSRRGRGGKQGEGRGSLPLMAVFKGALFELSPASTACDPDSPSSSSFVIVVPAFPAPPELIILADMRVPPPFLFPELKNADPPVNALLLPLDTIADEPLCWGPTWERFVERVGKMGRADVFCSTCRGGRGLGDEEALGEVEGEGTRRDLGFGELS